jgi:hypothetical protein
MWLGFLGILTQQQAYLMQTHRLTTFTVPSAARTVDSVGVAWKALTVKTERIRE